MKPHLKALFAIICLTLCLALCLTACGNDSENSESTASKDTSSENTVSKDTESDKTEAENTEAENTDAETPNPENTESKETDFEDRPPIINYSDVLGVGEVKEAAIVGVAVKAVISDESVLKINDLLVADGKDVTTFTVQGLKNGTVTVSFIASDGATVLEHHEYTVKDEETVRICEGNLISDVSVDKTTAEVYSDDTLVTYTVKTSADVDRLEFVQLTHTYQMFFFDELIEEEARPDKDLVIFELDSLTVDESTLSDTLVKNEAKRTFYSATRAVSGDTATWTVKWDLGDTAVRFIRIKAFDKDSNAEQASYVKLNITFPTVSYDAEGYAEAIKLFVKSNSTYPLFFKTDYEGNWDFNDLNNLFRGNGDNFADRFADTAVYGGNSVEYITNYLPVISYDTHGFMQKWDSYVEIFGDKNILCDFGPRYGFTLSFYYPISDELRAVIAYQNGYEIDEALFPYAHSILDSATAVLEEIITDGMTDFEKEKAIYTWLYERGVNGSENGWTPLPDGVSEQKAITTAYGILNNYGGNCMGWSGAFYTLCNMAGLDCVTVDVKADAGGAAEDFIADHRINMIKLDGEYYFVEAFWSWQKSDPSDGTYRYMNMSTEKAATLYTWLVEEKGGPFVCDYESYLVNEQTGEPLSK